MKEAMAIVVVMPIAAETIFRNVLRMICHTDFKCSSNNFHKERKQPTKYQHLDVTPLNLNLHSMAS